jgi:hypothetical protein
MPSKWKTPKAKKGAWFVKVRGSYLPASWQGWLLYVPMIGLAVWLIVCAYNSADNIAHVFGAFILAIIGVGAIFTVIAARKS